MKNEKPGKLRLRRILCALAALALLTQGAMAEADPLPEVVIEDASIEIDIEGANPDQGEAIIGLADEFVPEEDIPASGALLLDGLDGLDALGHVPEDLEIESDDVEAPAEDGTDRESGLASNESGEAYPFDYIAYSSVSGIYDAPINTAAHYLRCCSPEYAFASIKGDLQLTADNRIVMCHDAGFTLNAEGRITRYNSANMIDIRGLTYSQCMALQYEKTYRDEYVGVCDFETYIGICARNGKNAYITIRDRGIPELVNEMMSIITRYDMQSRCIINSANQRSLQAVRAYDPTIALSWVISGGVPSQAQADAAVRLGNCLMTLFAYPTSSYGGIDKLKAGADRLAYAREQGLRLYAAVLDRASLTDELLQLGISGAQFSEVPFDPQHQWGEPTYTWTDDNSAVTAVRTCVYEPRHRQTERVKTTTATTIAPACESAGTLEYRADFANPGFAPQTRTDGIPPLGHSWGEPTYAWAEDNSAVTATRICAYDAAHVETETVNTLSEVAVPATEEAVGWQVYTATFANPAFETQTRQVEIPKLEPLIVDEVTVKGGVYRLNHRDRTAAFIRPERDTARSLRVYDAVEANHTIYQVTSIDAKACRDMRELVLLTVGANVTAIGERAFSDCPKLKRVEGCERVSSIAKSAFSRCGALRSVPSLGRLERMGSGAFLSTALREIDLGNRLAAIGNNAFYGCGKLNAVYGGNAVTAIGKSAFYGCKSLRVLPQFPKLESVRASAFKNCRSLMEITLGPRVSSIGKNTFYGCKRLRSIMVKTKRLGRTCVGANAFKGTYKSPNVFCPRRMARAYKRLFRSKGMSRGAVYAEPAR